MTTTTTTGTAAQAEPCPAASWAATRDTRESLTLEFNDATQACEVLAALCEHVHRQYTRDQPWHTARAVNRVAIAAAALHYFSAALLEPMLERLHAGGETLYTSPDQLLLQALAQAQAAGHDTRPAPAPVAPRLVKPSSVARLEALRGEFSDDPEGISFILDFLHVFDKSPQAVLDALEHNLETPDAAAAASPPPTPATAATTPSYPRHCPCGPEGSPALSPLGVPPKKKNTREHQRTPERYHPRAATRLSRHPGRQAPFLAPPGPAPQLPGPRAALPAV